MAEQLPDVDVSAAIEAISAPEVTAPLDSLAHGELEQVKLEALREKVKELQTANSLRTDFAKWGKWFIAVYLVFVGLLLLAQAACNWFNLADSVICMLLGTTTLNVLAVFHSIVKYLFPNNVKSEG